MSLLRFFGSETAVKQPRWHRRCGIWSSADWYTLEQFERYASAHGQVAAPVAATYPPGPPGSGVIGEEHLRRRCVGVGGEAKSFKYFRTAGYDGDGRPYVVEIATCPYKKWVSGKIDKRGRELITGVNFSATLENPFQTFRGMMSGLDETLADLRAGSDAPVIVCVHYACPHIEYLDRGKSRIGLE